MEHQITENILEIKDLHVQYNTDDAVVYALNGINLTLKQGIKLGLVGETGAGKTTLALSILRLLPKKVGEISKGSICYNGEQLLEQPEASMLSLRGKKISMIFQDPMTSLNPTQTVGNQILEVLNLHFQTMSKEDKNQRVDDILQMVGILPARRGSFPHEFSGGMKQRIVIAMALIAEPELLLADEPTTALDVTIQAQILDLMQRLREKFNSAVMLITHDLGVVADFCDEVAVIYAGRVVEYGTIEQVFARESNHPYTAGMFNCIPDLTHSQARLAPIPGRMADPRIPIQGCCFAERCPFCMDKCKITPPEMYMKNGHGVMCYRNQEEGVE